jgi:hypothetical protein
MVDDGNGRTGLLSLRVALKNDDTTWPPKIRQTRAVHVQWRLPIGGSQAPL